MEQVNYQVNPKETIYFYIKLFVSLIVYAALAYGASILFSEGVSPAVQVILIYAGLIILFLIFQLGILIGNLKGNAIRISEHQLPDIYEIVKKQSVALGLSKIPHVYLLQAGGILNAFATRFLGTNYVVIYSDVLGEAYENNIEAVQFIVGHELGHVKRKHIVKRLLLLPSFIIPFLGLAYSRACEYTCDNIGAALSPKGARNGLLLLASGKRLYHKINVERFMYQSQTEDGFWPWFSEKISSHPKLAKRVLKFKGDEFATVMKQAPVVAETIDHSAYFPRN